MAELDKNQYFEQINKLLGDDTSKESIRLLDDLVDTYTALEKRAEGDSVDWKEKYEENNKAWQEKYRQRFFSGGNINPNIQNDGREPSDLGVNENIRIDDLFK